MAKFTIPTFNLGANLWTIVTGDYTLDTAGAPRVAATPCNLAYGVRVNVASTGGTAYPGIPIMAMNLLLQKGTDVQGPQCNVGGIVDSLTGMHGDYVEVPAGTGRYYIVGFVDDIGRGFANEHRTALIFALPFSWPTPIP